MKSSRRKLIGAALSAAAAPSALIEALAAANPAQLKLVPSIHDTEIHWNTGGSFDVSWPPHGMRDGDTYTLLGETYLYKQGCHYRVVRET